MRETDPPDFSWASPILNFGWWLRPVWCQWWMWSGFLERKKIRKWSKWSVELCEFQSLSPCYLSKRPFSLWSSEPCLLTVHPPNSYLGKVPKKNPQKRLVFCCPIFNCPPKPYFDPLTCFRCQLNLCMRRQQIQVVQLWRALTKQSPGGRQGHDNYIQSGRCGN